jgi:DNA-binding MarR family transcriptional regulator
MKSQEALLEAYSQAIQRAGTLTVLHTNAIAAHIGLSATEFEALDVIQKNQPITAGQLAVKCGLTTGGITGLVDRLTAAGFVKRVRDTSDRRRVLLYTIEKAEISHKIWKLYRPISEGFYEVTRNYTQKELQLLIDAQQAMNDMAEQVIEKIQSTL